MDSLVFQINKNTNFAYGFSNVFSFFSHLENNIFVFL